MCSLTCSLTIECVLLHTEEHSKPLKRTSLLLQTITTEYYYRLLLQTITTHTHTHRRAFKAIEPNVDLRVLVKVFQSVYNMPKPGHASLSKRTHSIVREHGLWYSKRTRSIFSPYTICQSLVTRHPYQPTIRTQYAEAYSENTFYSKRTPSKPGHASPMSANNPYTI